MSEQIKIGYAIVKKHPIYTSYGATETCAIYNFNKKEFIIKSNSTRYFEFEWGSCICFYDVFQFVWECFHGPVTKNCVIKNTVNPYINCLKYLEPVSIFENN